MDKTRSKGPLSRGVPTAFSQGRVAPRPDARTRSILADGKGATGGVRSVAAGRPEAYLFDHSLFRLLDVVFVQAVSLMSRSLFMDEVLFQLPCASSQVQLTGDKGQITIQTQDVTTMFLMVKLVVKETYTTFLHSFTSIQFLSYKQTNVATACDHTYRAMNFYLFQSTRQN